MQRTDKHSPDSEDLRRFRAEPAEVLKIDDKPKRKAKEVQDKESSR